MFGAALASGQGVFMALTHEPEIDQKREMKGRSRGKINYRLSKLGLCGNLVHYIQKMALKTSPPDLSCGRHDSKKSF
jgi:hypothetical protein